MPTISGTTRNASGVLCAKMVRAYRRRDGKYAGEVVSNATTGAYSITALDSSPHVVYEIDGTVIPGDPNWDSVIAALHMNGTDNSQSFVDEVGNTVSVTGTAKLSTDAAAFGGISALFDGSVSYLTVPVANPIGTSDFAITFWLTLVTVPTSGRGLFGPSGKGNSLFMTVSPTLVYGGTYGGNTPQKSFSPVAGTRYYIELSRVSGNMWLFIDGIPGSPVQSSENFSNTSIRVGAHNANLAEMPNCRIDDFKIVKIGGHTSAYTPPSASFLDAQSISSPTEKPQIFDNVIPI